MDCDPVGSFRGALGFGKRWGGVVLEDAADAAERRGVGLE